MNTKYIQVLALVLIGGLCGCSTISNHRYTKLPLKNNGLIQLALVHDPGKASKNYCQLNENSFRQAAAELQEPMDDPPITPSAYGTTSLNYSNDDSPMMSGVVVTDLGGGGFIHAGADSWLALVEKVKPTFAWNGCDMMWIEKDKRGQPLFVLDEAYLYEPTNQPRQWVLLRNSTPKMSEGDLRPEAPKFFYSTYNLLAVAALQDAVPHSDHGDNYAVAISTSRKFGTVYEIGWQREMSVGSGHAEYGRRIYVLRDRTNKWHFLGEVPEEGGGKGGGSTVQARVVWNAASTNKLKLQIRFHAEQLTSPYNFGEDETNIPPYLTVCSEYVLAGDFPSRFRSTGERPYLLAEKDDTMEKIILRLCCYLPGWNNWPETNKEEIKKKRILEMWATAIAQLNPQLPRTGKVREGTRIQLLKYDEKEARLNALEKPDSP